MTLTSCELREKDVINVCDGKKLGYICDMDIDTDCGRVTAVYVSDKFFSINGSKNCIKIRWDMIKCIGEDTILVDAGKYAAAKKSAGKSGKEKAGSSICK